jgi:hypothetical protein
VVAAADFGLQRLASLVEDRRIVAGIVHGSPSAIFPMVPEQDPRAFTFFRARHGHNGKAATGKTS